MIRALVLAVLVLVNFALQTTIFPHFAIFGVIPDTALIFIVSYAILRGEIEGAIFGFFTGLVHDIMGGMVIGFFALLGLLTGYICGKPFRDFFKDNYFLPFFVVVVACVAYQIAIYAATQMIFGRLEFWTYAGSIILPKTIYTASLSVPLYSLLHFINARLERVGAIDA